MTLQEYAAKRKANQEAGMAQKSALQQYADRRLATHGAKAEVYAPAVMDAKVQQERSADAYNAAFDMIKERAQFGNYQSEQDSNDLVNSVSQIKAPQTRTAVNGSLANNKVYQALGSTNPVVNAMASVDNTVAVNNRLAQSKPQIVDTASQIAEAEKGYFGQFDSERHFNAVKKASETDIEALQNEYNELNDKINNYQLYHNTYDNGEEFSANQNRRDELAGQINQYNQLMQYANDPAYRENADVMACGSVWEKALYIAQHAAEADTAMKQKGMSDAARGIVDSVKAVTDIGANVFGASAEGKQNIEQAFKPFYDTYDTNDANYEQWKQNSGWKYVPGAEFAADMMSGTIVSLPMNLVAVMSGGSSAVLGASSKILSGNAAQQTTQALGNSLKTLTNDPNFWASAVTMFGSSYQGAKENGASDFDAALVAVLNSFAGSVVEVGGGIQIIPEGANSITEWLKSLAEEGREEVIQGIIEKIANQAVYADNIPYFSTDSSGVIDPGRAVQEFAGGAFGGALMGGGTMLGNYAEQSAGKKATENYTTNASAAIAPEISFNISEGENGNNQFAFTVPEYAVNGLSQWNTEAKQKFAKHVIEDYFNPGSKIVNAQEAQTQLQQFATVPANVGEKATSRVTFALGNDEYTADVAVKNTEQGARISSVKNVTYLKAADNAAQTARLTEETKARTEAARQAETTDTDSLKIISALEDEAVSTAEPEIQIEAVGKAIGYSDNLIGYMQETYNEAPDSDVENFVSGYSSIYNAARTGALSQNEAMSFGGFIGSIGFAAVSSAAYQGRLAYEADLKEAAQARENARRARANNVKGKVTDQSGNRSKSLTGALKTLGKKTGFSFRIVESISDQNGAKTNGYFDAKSGEIVLSAQADNILSAAVHECTHFISEYASDEYAQLKKFVIEFAKNKGTDFLMTAVSEYKRLYGMKNVQNLLEEITADISSELINNDDFVAALFTNKEFINEVAAKHKSLAQRIADFFSGLVDSLKAYISEHDGSSNIGKALASAEDAAEKFGKISELWLNALDKAGENYKSQANKNTASAEGSGVRYSIKKSTDGKNYVEVSNDIANLTDRSSILKALKAIVDTKFPNLINVHGQNIGINKKTANEWVFSKSAEKLFNKEIAKYEDKIKAFDNSDELLQAAENFVGEAKKHTRKDNFVEFARGKVQYKVGNNGYEADIIVGITKSGSTNLYDIIAIKDKKITELIKYSIRNNDVPKSRHSSVTDNTISQNDTDVNTSISENGGNDTRKFSLSISEQDITELRSIGRKSVNEFTSEDIGKTEKWARKFYQELGTKSPFFRAWFGDWRKYDTGKITVANEIGSERGVIENEDTGWSINVSGKVFSETNKHHSVPSITARPYLDYINDIVKNAILLDSCSIDKEKSPNSLFMHSMYAVADIGNGAELLKLYVEEMNDPNGEETLKRTYKLLDIEKQQLGAKGSSVSPSLVTPTADVNTISDLFGLVKRYDKNFKPNSVNKALLNEDGTPRVFYHRTNAEFTVFRKGEKSGLSGKGIYFSYYPMHYGKNTIEAYLKMENPMTKENEPEGAREINSSGIPTKIIDDFFEIFPQFDGIIGRDEVVVKEPTQIKSATDNIGTYDGNNTDIRFQLKDTSEVDYEAIIAENQELKKKVATLQEEMTLTEGHRVERKACEKLAKKLIDNYGSHYDKKTLSDNLEHIFNYIASENADAGEAINALTSVAKSVIEKSERLDTSFEDSYGKIVFPKIKLSENMVRSLSAAYGSYAELKDACKGLVQISKAASPMDATGIDLLYQELNGEYQDLFPEDIISEEDQFTRILEVAELQKPRYVNELKADEDTYAYIIASELFDEYFEAPQMKTFADRKASELNALRNESRQKLAQTKVEIRERYEKRLEDLRAEKNDKISEVRSKRDEKILELKAQFIEQKKNARERQNITAKRHQIGKLMKRLESRLLHPTKTKYVPVYLYQAVIDVCRAVDLNTGRTNATGNPTKASEKLRRLKSVYDKLAQDNDYAYSSSYDKFISERIEELAELTEGKTVYDLSLKDLNKLYELLRTIEYQVATAVKLIGDKKARDVYETGIRIIDEINATKGYNKDNLLHSYAFATLNPERVARKMTGYIQGSEWVQIMEDLSEGEWKSKQIEMEGQQLFKNILSGKENERLFADFTGHGKNSLVDIGAVDEKGNKVLVTKAMRTSVFLHSLNPDNAKHIQYGGLTVPDMKEYRKGNYNKAYDESVKVRLTTEQLAAIGSTLTDYEQRFAKTAFSFFNEFSKDYVNKTSLELLGYKKANVEKYFPIHTDRAFLKKEADGVKVDISIENKGFTKERVHSGNPVYLEDVSVVVSRHIGDVAQYAGLAIPVRNYSKVSNVTTKQYNTSVMDTIRNKYKTTAVSYFDNYITDLQGSRRGHDGTLEKRFNSLLGNYAQAVLAVNPSVSAIQLSAYPTAASEIGWGSITKALGRGFFRADLEKISKYTPALWSRYNGDSTREISEASKKTHGAGAFLANNAPWLMNWNQKMDEAIIGRLWYACEYYVDDNFKTLKKGTDEYYNKVAEWFEGVVLKTQANYTVSQRSDIMRSPNVVMKAFTMFRTESMNNFGVIMDALGDYKAQAERYKNDKSEGNRLEFQRASKHLARTVSSQVVAALTYSALKLLMAALMHAMKPWRDDEKNITAASVMGKFTRLTLETLGGLALFGSELTSIIEAVVLGERYYGIENTQLSALSDVADSIISLTSANKTNEAKFRGLSEKICQIAGIPLTNVGKIVEGLIKHTQDIANGEFGTFASDLARSDKELLYMAYMSGNTDEYERITGQFRAQGKTKQEVNKIIADQLLQYDSRCVEMAVCFESGQMERYLEIVGEMKSEGIEQDVAVTAMNSGVSEIKATIKSLSECAANGDASSDKYLEAIVKSAEYIGYGYNSAKLDTAVEEAEQKILNSEAQTAADWESTENTTSLYEPKLVASCMENGDYDGAVKAYSQLLQDKITVLTTSESDEDDVRDEATAALRTNLTSKLKPVYIELAASNPTEAERFANVLVREFGYSRTAIQKWQ